MRLSRPRSTTRQSRGAWVPPAQPRALRGQFSGLLRHSPDTRTEELPLMTGGHIPRSLPQNLCSLFLKAIGN